VNRVLSSAVAFLLVTFSILASVGANRGARAATLPDGRHATVSVNTARHGRVGHSTFSAAMSSDPAASPGATGLTTDDLTDPALSATQLAQTLVGPGVTVTNAHFTGAAVAGGTFSGDASILGIGYGVVLSTGMVSSVIGPNNGNKASTDNGAPGDPALDSLAGGSTYDAASLDFDFVPQSKTVSFQYPLKKSGGQAY